ncbi:MAG: hypothetical protein PHV57_07155 [Methanomicrobiaceae archaeon]|nr:hypothetical protein [Methanomicrobiaceae archaeon]
MQDRDFIVKQRTRVLYPREARVLRAELSFRNQLIFDAMLYTGMRTVEFWRFIEHPDWYKPSRKAIDLPHGAMMKKKAKQAERTVLLSNAGVQAIETLLSYMKKHPGEVRPISRQNWLETLQRAALKAMEKGELSSIVGVVPKMTRKTWVSWLLATYPEREGSISLSMGHDLRTMLKHYAGLGWPGSARDEMRIYTSGWG